MNLFRKKRREPLGRGYDVYGSEEISETGGKTYKAKLKEERKKKLIKTVKNTLNKIQTIAENIEENNTNNKDTSLLNKGTSLLGDNKKGGRL